MINFGISCQPEDETQGYMLVPRSSTFKKTGCILTNSIGTIDPGYTGHLMANVHKVLTMNEVASRFLTFMIIYQLGLYYMSLICLLGVFLILADSYYRLNISLINIFIDWLFPAVFKEGERYFQLVAADMKPIQIEVVEEFPRETERNTGGFGSTDTFTISYESQVKKD
jgi:dUTPase